MPKIDSKDINLTGSTSSKEITDYLKGFAIISVYINHFANGYITDTLKGNANGFVSIFFILSGFGIYLSLKRRSDSQEKYLYLRFFQKRFVRLYPLFWIVYVLFNRFPDGFLGFWGLNFVKPSIWFVPAIIQCYLITPFAFVFFKNLKIKYAFLMLLIIFAGLNFSLFSLGLEPVRTIGYRELFFNHVFLFLMGFILAKMNLTKVIPNYAIWLAFFLFLYLNLGTRAETHPIVCFLFSLSAVLVCYAFLSRKSSSRLPLKHFLEVMGQKSYSIFLFHAVGFAVLGQLGLLEEMGNTVTNIIIILVMSPIIIFLCSSLEIVVNEFLFEEKDIKIALKKSLVVANSFRNPF